MTFTQIKNEVPTLVGAAEQCRASTGFPPRAETGFQRRRALVLGSCAVVQAVVATDCVVSSVW